MAMTTTGITYFLSIEDLRRVVASLNHHVGQDAIDLAALHASIYFSAHNILSNCRCRYEQARLAHIQRHQFHLILNLRVQQCDESMYSRCLWQ
jgi:hypothetical protein